MRPENFIDEKGLRGFKIPENIIKEVEKNIPPDKEPFMPSEFDLKPGRMPDVLDVDFRTEKLFMKDTGNENVGRGLFASKDFEPNEDVFEFNGTQRGEKFHPIAALDGYSSHSIVVGQKDKPYFVYATPNEQSPLRYLNHSCNPNIARVSDDLFGFKAIRPIKAGEELTADYSLLEANPYWKMDNCGCGSKNCRHKIGSVSSLSAEYLYQNWHRLIPEMQVTAIEYSVDPKISELRNELGADCILENNPFLVEYSRDEILNSTRSDVVRQRNLLGAKKLAERFLDEESFAPTAEND